MSEKVDVGNQDPGDDALVFSEVIASCDLNKEVFAKSLADVIAHEAGHLLGYAHRVPGLPGRTLDDVAETVTWSGEIPDGTVWSGGDIQVVTGDATVPAGATLTVQPDAVVNSILVRP
ncbi:MAG: hypothetical protein ABIL62_01620 [Planctomycetota bacterium]